jgi:hypothetical protein
MVCGYWFRRCVPPAFTSLRWMARASERTGVAEDSYLLRFSMANGVEGVLMQSGGAWGNHASMSRVAGKRGTLSLESAPQHLRMVLPACR